MEEKKNKALHWPIGIVLGIFAVIGMSIWTIMVAVQNPVVMDDFYFQKYQDVDNNYYVIQEKQIKFDKKYDIKYNLTELSIGENQLIVNIVDKQSLPVIDANVTVRITRPHLNTQDINLKILSQGSGNYKLEKFNIDTIGRWQILSKVQIGDLISFTKTDVNATK